MATTSDNPSHDEINLVRLVRRLDRTASKDETKKPSLVSMETWIQAQGMLQKVKAARSLLKNVELELYDVELSSIRTQRFDDIRVKLDKVESHYKSIEKPQLPLPTPILPSIPRPSIPPPTLTLDLSSSSSLHTPSSADPESGINSSPSDKDADNLLLPAETPSYPSSTSFSFPTPMPLPLIPTLPKDTTTSSDSNSKSTAITTGANVNRFLQGTTALQNDLLDQVNQMAVQLRKNVVHFGELLKEDKAVVEETQEKLDGNYEGMVKERKRLRDRSGKSWNNTWLTLAIVLVVLLVFVAMVGLIRFSRF